MGIAGRFTLLYKSVNQKYIGLIRVTEEQLRAPHGPENYEIGYLALRIQRARSGETGELKPFDISQIFDLQSSTSLLREMGELVIVSRHVTPMTILKVEKPPLSGGGEEAKGNEVTFIPHQEGIRYKTMGTNKADGSTYVAAVTASLAKTDIFQDLFAGAVMSLAGITKYSSSMGISPESPLKLAILAGMVIISTKVFKDTKEAVYSIKFHNWIKGPT